MDRRNFLASIGLTGYSFLVSVEGPAALLAAPRSADEYRHDLDRIAPTADPDGSAQEHHMTLVELACDVCVAGGGMAGVCAALAAAGTARRSCSVQDRSRLGGNSSSEVKMHIVGANCHTGRPGWREGGLLEEIRLDDAANNAQRCWELWDLLLYDKLDQRAEHHSVARHDPLRRRSQGWADRERDRPLRPHRTPLSHPRQDFLRLHRRLAARFGGGRRDALGHEARAEFGESLAAKVADKQTQGCSILFTARDYGKPMPFQPPKWARKITEKQLRYRSVKTWEYGYWWIEWGGEHDTIRDNERIRFELLGIVLGVWDFIKNSGKHPTSANWAMDWVGMLPGKREARRLVGDHILTQNDLMGLNGDFEDAVCIGGWNLDDHPPSGFDDPNKPPFASIRLKEVYNVPLRSLYSKNVKNLMMAGRNVSASHVAFTSLRVMGTCSVEGQATGTAAALCASFEDFTTRFIQK